MKEKNKAIIQKIQSKNSPITVKIEWDRLSQEKVKPQKDRLKSI